MIDLVVTIVGAVAWLGALIVYLDARRSLRDANRILEDVKHEVRMMQVREELHEDLCRRPGARSTWEGPEVTR